MDQKIFKAYDVRGIYPSELNEKAAENIAQALAKHFSAEGGPASGGGKSKIIVGRDGRLSSPSLYKTVIKALEIIPPLAGSRQPKIYKKSGGRNSKLEIVPVGTITTPMLYFLVNKLKADGGIMVTASHNPKEYNGLKVVGPKAKPISGTEIKELIG